LLLLAHATGRRVVPADLSISATGTVVIIHMMLCGGSRVRQTRIISRRDHARPLSSHTSIHNFHYLFHILTFMIEFQCFDICIDAKNCQSDARLYADFW
jgi:hypothetical protein